LSSQSASLTHATRPLGSPAHPANSFHKQADSSSITQNLVPVVLEVRYSRTKEMGTPCLYHCLFEIRLCSAKERGNGSLGLLDTGPIARTLPSGTKENANTHTGESPQLHSLIQQRRTLNIKVLPRCGQRSRAMQ
jgi:hypothetical protein